jgi:hypothetical protein
MESIDAFKLLIEKKCIDISLKDKKGLTVSDMISQNELTEFAAILRNNL